MTYTYQVVTGDGIILHGREHLSAKKANDAAAKLREKHSDAEVERVGHVGYGGRRYWLRRGSRWVLWSDEFERRRAAARGR